MCSLYFFSFSSSRQIIEMKLKAFFLLRSDQLFYLCIKALESKVSMTGRYFEITLNLNITQITYGNISRNLQKIRQKVFFRQTFLKEFFNHRKQGNKPLSLP